MIKKIPFLAAMALGFFVLAGCSVAGVFPSAVMLPPELAAYIQLAVTIAVVFILTQLTKGGLDLSGYQVQIVAAVYGAIIVVINELLAKVPASAEGVATALLNLIVAVLGAYGLHTVYKSIKTARAK